MPEFGETKNLSDLIDKNHNDLDARDAADVHPHSSLESIGAENHHTLPIRAVMWHDESTMTVGNALAHASSIAQRYNSQTRQSTAADGDTFKNDFNLKAGTYILYILGVSQTICGKQDIYIDDIKQTITPLDWYSNPATNNTVKTVSITVVGNGKHTLKSVVNGKNVSSTHYYIFLTKLWIK